MKYVDNHSSPRTNAIANHMDHVHPTRGRSSSTLTFSAGAAVLDAPVHPLAAPLARRHNVLGRDPLKFDATATSSYSDNVAI